MADLQELRATILHRQELDEELATLSPQLHPLEREIQRLKIEVHNKQMDAEQLTKPGLRSLVLRWTGKQEAAVTQAVRDARTLRDRLQAAVFRQETLQKQVDSIRQALDSTADAEAAYLRLLEAQQSDEAAIQEAAEHLRRLQQADHLRESLPEQLSQTNARLSKVLRTYETGDIQTDLSGNRFDNKFRTMKEYCIPAQQALTCLLALLEQYTTLYGDDLQAAAPGPWTVEQTYLTVPAFDAKDLHDRVHDVFCWAQRLERCLNGLAARRDDQERTWRRALRGILLTL